jgi:APA family basic amino acid/polyamine antiporter
VLILRRTDPDRPRPFRVPAATLTAGLGILSCLVLMASLPGETWIRLAIWLLIGLAIYAGYGRRHGRVTRGG